MTPRRCGDYTYTLLPDGNAKILAIYAEYENLTIPAQLDGTPVTILGETAFGIPFEEYNSFEDPVGRLWETVSIEEGITVISDHCFCRSHYMEHIHLPNSITYIGIGAFLECGLQEIQIPSSVTFIGRAAFSDCHFLRQVWIPDQITELEDYTFDFCNSMSHIRLPADLTRIGRGTFRECRSLTTLQLPKTLTTIDAYAFHGCVGLQQVTVPAGVSFIGEDAFLECDALTLLVEADSYAEQYAIDNHIPYRTEEPHYA